MYNNTIIQTHYKPYIPPPKKKAVNNNEEKQPETKGRVVNPNEYQNYQGQKQPSSDSFTRTSVQPPEKINIKQVKTAIFRQFYANKCSTSRKN